MFILPTFENAKVKRVPWLTIFIIVCCSWVFFVFQHNEKRDFDRLIIDYGKNGYFDLAVEVFNGFQETLPEGERSHLESHEDDGVFPEGKENQAHKVWFRYYINVWQKTTYDVGFQTGLRNNTITLPDTVDPMKWDELRTSYEDALDNIFRIKNAFRTAWPTLTTAFWSTFIHGDLYHLLGNMVFLFIVGAILEAVLGSWLFLLTYLVCALGCSYLTIPLHGPSAIGSIGASGAISAVMGAYSVVMGRTMVPAFVSLGIYFTNIKVPAVLLIVFWMGKEIIYDFLYPHSQVNYLAHLAGFIIGGGFGVVFKLVKGKAAKQLFESEQEDTDKRIDALLASSVELLRNLEPEKARQRLINALRIKKDDSNTLQQLFIVDLQIGEKQNLKRTAVKLLRLQVEDPALNAQNLSNYSEYIGKSGPPLPADILAALARIAIKKQNLHIAKTIINQLQEAETKAENHAELLLLFADFYLNLKQMKLANQIAIDLIKTYPDSREAREVRTLFASWRKAASSSK